MKRWLLKLETRRSKRRSSSRSRRLVFEHCEDRRVLSGNAAVDATAVAPTLQEGGFISLSTNTWLQTDANLFVSGYDSAINFSDQSQVYLLGNSQAFDLSSDQIHLWSAADQDSGHSGLARYQPILSGSTNQIGQSAESVLGAAPTGSYELKVPDLDIRPSEPPATDAESNGRDSGSLVVDNSNDQLASGSPGLSGGAAQMRVIDEPLQLATSGKSLGARAAREGGVLAVRTAVTTTQRAVDTRIARAIVYNLNHESELPIVAKPEATPVVAELARLIAFETFGELPEPPDEHSANDPLLESSQSQRSEARPTTTQTSQTPQEVGLPPGGLPDAADESDVVALANQTEPSKDTPSDRLDDDRFSTYAATFARWPMLATLVAGYLWIDHRHAKTTRAVQLPPRRRQGSRVE